MVVYRHAPIVQMYLSVLSENNENTRNYNLKKHKQNNNQKKIKTNNDLDNIIHEIKDVATRAS